MTADEYKNIIGIYEEAIKRLRADLGDPWRILMNVCDTKPSWGDVWSLAVAIETRTTPNSPLWGLYNVSKAVEELRKLRLASLEAALAAVQAEYAS